MVNYVHVNLTWRNSWKLPVLVGSHATISVVHVMMDFRWSCFQLFICSLAFTTFTVDLGRPHNRLQLSFILLLTTITFKFVVSQTLPRISYLTYLVCKSARHGLVI